ncbi:hypothetical protein ENBRE01_1860 [Enteropsectra breve]|nr:hypothetical protein ENBRE01_1860 [Enteropsectra breve]
MNGTKASIILALILIAGGSLGILFSNYNKQNSQNLEPEKSISTADQEKICSHYSAAVKFITSPAEFQKELINSKFDEAEKPIHYHIKSIITDPAWDQEHKNKELSEKLLNLYSLVGGSETEHSIPLYGIISGLVAKIDAERGQDNAIFKCKFESKLVHKDSRVVAANETEHLSIIEGIKNISGTLYPRDSLNMVFCKVPILKSVEDKRETYQNSKDFYCYKKIFTREAVIFSLEGCGNSRILGLEANFTTTTEDLISKTHRIRSVLYLDKESKKKELYKTEMFSDTNDFHKKERGLENGKNLQILYYMYTGGQQ